MTIRQYINDKLRAFGITEAQFVDVSYWNGVELDDDVSDYDPAFVGRIMAGMLEECILSPKMTSINESGFSASWDFSALGRYYQWLCRRWNHTPDTDVLDALGISRIIDRSDCW